GCIKTKALEQGKGIHAHMNATGFEPTLFQRNCLFNMYVKCASLDNARKVFDEMPCRNTVSWSALLAGYAQEGQGFYWDVSASNGLVNMYAKCRNIEEARKEFDLMPQLDLISWNAIISGYNQNENHEESLKLYKLIQADGLKPDCITFICVLSSCANLDAMGTGKQIHANLFNSGLELDVSVGNALITLYAKCRSILHSRQVFEGMNKKDLVSWNAIIGGYAQNELSSEAIELFQFMQKTNPAMNNVTFVSILGALTCPETLDFGKEVHAH
ncbi:hypothetical protein KI387_033959, partial [Taxus chinensis]